MKRKLLFSVLFLTAALLTNSPTNAQVGINFSGTAADSSALLDVASKHRGVLVPRMTMAQHQQQGF
jgi:hypothetical protein